MKKVQRVLWRGLGYLSEELKVKLSLWVAEEVKWWRIGDMLAWELVSNREV